MTVRRSSDTHTPPAAPGLRLDGIFCYPGHIWAKPAEQAAPLAAVAAKLQEAIDRFDRHGLCRGVVSGGSTPTAYQSHLVPQVTEIRPGTYVFNDMNTVRGGFCTLDDCAAAILCTVVSDAVAGQVVLDGGTKTFTSDRCGPAPDSGHGFIVEYPDAMITKLTEENDLPKDIRDSFVKTAMEQLSATSPYRKYLNQMAP